VEAVAADVDQPTRRWHGSPFAMGLHRLPGCADCSAGYEKKSQSEDDPPKCAAHMKSPTSATQFS
jgi:hypothetical protein